MKRVCTVFLQQNEFYKIISEMLPHASWMHRSAHEYMHERVAFLGKKNENTTAST